MERRVPKLVSFATAAKERPFFSEASLRDKRYHALERLNAKGETVPPNGFADVFVTIGRRVFVDLDRLDAKVEACRGGIAA